MNEVKVKDLKAGDNIEVIELTVKSVGQGKLGKQGTPYQHTWLTDGTGDIRFSLFGDDVNKLQEGQRIKVISSYIKEYPAGSGKFQLTPIKDSGAWQIVSEQGAITKSDDIVAPPFQIVNSDARDNRISKLTCVKAAAEFFSHKDAEPQDVIDTAQYWYDWVMSDESLPSEPESEDDEPVKKAQEDKGPLAVKLWLIAESAKREWGGPPTIKQLGLLNGLLNDILGGDKERHTWLKWTFNVESSKELTGGQVVFMLDKLVVTKSATTGNYEPTSEKFVQAIKAMFTQALKDAGQTEMTFEESVEELYGP